jgi:hypothetical protein
VEPAEHHQSYLGKHKDMLNFFGVIGRHLTQCIFSFIVWGVFKKGNAPGVGGMGVSKTFSFF